MFRYVQNKSQYQLIVSNELTTISNDSLEFRFLGVRRKVTCILVVLDGPGLLRKIKSAQLPFPATLEILYHRVFCPKAYVTVPEGRAACTFHARGVRSCRGVSFLSVKHREHKSNLAKGSNMHADATDERVLGRFHLLVEVVVASNLRLDSCGIYALEGKCGRVYG